AFAPIVPGCDRLTGPLALLSPWPAGAETDRSPRATGPFSPGGVVRPAALDAAAAPAASVGGPGVRGAPPLQEPVAVLSPAPRSGAPRRPRRADRRPRGAPLGRGAHDQLGRYHLLHRVVGLDALDG